MVAAARRGMALRAIARTFRVGLATVQLWIRRAGGLRLDRVDWGNRPSVPHRTQRTSIPTEDLVLRVRRQLKETSDLGEFGAGAVHAELLRRNLRQTSSVRTIGRILKRRGALDGQRRVRRPAPAPGWYIPDVAARRAELDSFDAVEGLVIKDGPQVEVLNGVSLHGGLVASWPMEAVTAKAVVTALVAHWREVGLPDYAQFDNDTRFQGAHQYPDSFGRVTRLCLSLGVIPVFTPPREHGFQAAIENFNGRWQAKVWARFLHESLPALKRCSARYIVAARERVASRIEASPERRPFPTKWGFDLQAPLRGRLIFLRRTTERGRVELLGHTMLVAPTWQHRLVRAEVHLDDGAIRFYGLRRADATSQPLLCEIGYATRRHRFHG